MTLPGLGLSLGSPHRLGQPQYEELFLPAECLALRDHAIAVASGFGDLAICRKESDRPAFVDRLEILHQEHPTPAADFQTGQDSLGLATPQRGRGFGEFSRIQLIEGPL